jgi:hypothetical protein
MSWNISLANMADKEVAKAELEKVAATNGLPVKVHAVLEELIDLLPGEGRIMVSSGGHFDMPGTPANGLEWIGLNVTIAHDVPLSTEVEVEGERAAQPPAERA